VLRNTAVAVIVYFMFEHIRLKSALHDKLAPRGYWPSPGATSHRVLRKSGRGTQVVVLRGDREAPSPFGKVLVAVDVKVIKCPSLLNMHKDTYGHSY
jgi:hypothetical protein